MNISNLIKYIINITKHNMYQIYYNKYILKGNLTGFDDRLDAMSKEKFQR